VVVCVQFPESHVEWDWKLSTPLPCVSSGGHHWSVSRTEWSVATRCCTGGLVTRRKTLDAITSMMWWMVSVCCTLNSGCIWHWQCFNIVDLANTNKWIIKTVESRSLCKWWRRYHSDVADFQLFLSQTIYRTVLMLVPFPSSSLGCCQSISLGVFLFDWFLRFYA